MANEARSLEALRLALRAYLIPAGLRAIRAQPLPRDVSLVLEIAAGNEALTREVALELAREPDLVREASVHYIEMVLLAQGSDAYRTLGVNEDASLEEIRRNMGLIVRWVHPDAGRAGYKTLYAQRVTQAWEGLKSPERRMAYDQSRAMTREVRRGKWRGDRRQRLGQSPPGVAPGMEVAIRSEASPSLVAKILRFFGSKRGR